VIIGAAQAIALLETFPFWSDRLEAVPVFYFAAHEQSDAVRRYFASAPGPIADEAARILADSYAR
jgi:hypothetical protein